MYAAIALNPIHTFEAVLRFVFGESWLNITNSHLFTFYFDRFLVGLWLIWLSFDNWISANHFEIPI